MKKKNPKLKGLKTPNLFVFIHGFVNGRMRTAAVDGERGYVNSAYVHGRIHLFDEFCKKRIVQLEKETSEPRSEAQTLILELQALPCPPAIHDQPNAQAEKFPDTVTEAQSCRAKAAAAAKNAEIIAAHKQKREDIIARRSWIIRRLIKIREQLALSERVCAEELSATAHALQDRFCVYGHGALLKPVCPDHIPAIEFESFLANYLAESEALQQKITAVLEEEV